MKSINLLEKLEFHDKDPLAQPLHVDRNGRALLFTLKPGQSIREHNAPSSPFFVVILQGKGIFAGGDGIEQTIGPNTLLIFDPGENHFIRALDELVFVGFLQGVPGAQTK
jgi:quercetin dioxygenase-like cupin family protein